MPKNSIRDYSATASSNTDIQSVDIDENCAASGINNAIREVMADLKDVSTGAVALETPSADQLNVDNIRIDGNTISSTDTNGDITLDPDGTGDVIVASGNLLHQRTSNTISGTSVNKMTLGDGTGQYGVIVDVGSGSGYYGFAKGGTYNSRIRYDYTSDFMAFDVNGAERMRIDASGDMKYPGTNAQSIMTNAHSGAAGATNRRGMIQSGDQLVFHTGSGTANIDAIKLYTGFSGQAGSTFAALQFLVQSDGDVQNRNNSYGSTSDLKLKQDIVAASSQWDDIKAVQVKNYRFKDQVANLGDDNAPTMLGVVAQDLESAGMSGLVIDKPDIVDGVDLGTTTKSVKYSVLYMKAIKALQEAMDRIETLETEMTALKARVTALEA